MDDHVGRLVATVGADRAAAEKAVGSVSLFFADARRADCVRARARQLFVPTLTNSQTISTTGGTRGAHGVAASGNRVMMAAPCMSAVMAIARKANRHVHLQAELNAAGPVVGATSALSAHI
jgi:limonene-1,2-epoxide hydrolase